jgi:post-segregation antitoxin (ccd killing protein)
MPKVSVYLPDELYRAARDEDLPISALAQRAIEQALRESRTDKWVDAVRGRPPRVTNKIDTSSAVAAARDEFGA